LFYAGEQQGEKKEGGVFEEFKQKLEEKEYKLQMGTKLSIHSEESIKFMTPRDRSRRVAGEADGRGAAVRIH
jgi:hypothetical protein